MHVKAHDFCVRPGMANRGGKAYLWVQPQSEGEDDEVSVPCYYGVLVVPLSIGRASVLAGRCQVRRVHMDMSLLVGRSDAAAGIIRDGLGASAASLRCRASEGFSHGFSRYLRGGIVRNHVRNCVTAPGSTPRLWAQKQLLEVQVRRRLLPIHGCAWPETCREEARATRQHQHKHQARRPWIFSLAPLKPWR